MAAQQGITRVDQGEIEETLNRIKSHPGVVGVVVATQDAIPLRSTFDAKLTHQYCSLIAPLARRASNVLREIDNQDELKFLRLRALKNEIMVAPQKDYLLIVVQDQHAAFMTVPLEGGNDISATKQRAS